MESIKIINDGKAMYAFKSSTYISILMSLIGNAVQSVALIYGIL